MEEFASLWSYNEGVDELKQKLLYTTLELEAAKAENEEEMKRNTESMKQLLQLLKLACQERDEARDQLQKLLIKIMPLSDEQILNPNNPMIPNHFASHLTIPAKGNSSITESNSFSDAYNHSSSPVDSLFDPISSPEFSNINMETPFDYHHSGILSNGLSASAKAPKVDQATMVMEGMIKGKTLPHKGKLLQSVLEAGPLLQTLMVAGSLPRWRNPPPLQAFHIPPVAAAEISATQKQAGENSGQFLKSTTMLLKQSQSYAEMACGSSSQMMSGGGGCGALSFGDVNFGGDFSPIGKRQRFQ